MSNRTPPRNAFEAADEYRRLVLSRTNLLPEEIVCPREKSELTPCIARDVWTAVGDYCGKPSVCIGCEFDVYALLRQEQSKHGNLDVKPVDVKPVNVEASQAQAEPDPFSIEQINERAAVMEAAILEFLEWLDRIEKGVPQKPFNTSLRGYIDRLREAVKPPFPPKGMSRGQFKTDD